MSTKHPAAKIANIPASAQIAIVAARFNGDIVDQLLRGCIDRLIRLGVAESKLTVHRVPGAFELPVAAKLLADTGRFSAIICLGAVIRGDTPHFDFVAGEAARGVQQVAIDESLPVIFGVLTTNNYKQATDRIGGRRGHAGRRAADAAVEMIEFAGAIRKRGKR
jgi:6,7-dimethyl-8-ribityllumazine synthase